MTREELAKALAQYNTFGNGFFGPSLMDDYRNANRQLSALNSMDGVNAGDKELFTAGLRNARGTALAEMGIAGLSGATALASGAMQSAQIQDTSDYQNQINDFVYNSNYNFVNYDQLANDMSQNYLSGMPSYNDIRGMNGIQKAGSLVTSGLQGASTGLQIGGPIGAAVGGAVGLLAGGIGIASGDRAARDKERELNAQAVIAQDAANQNYHAAHERISEYNMRNGVANAAEKGGKIDRQKSISSYVNKTLGSAKPKEHAGNNISRSSVEGGVRFRFRVK